MTLSIAVYFCLAERFELRRALKVVLNLLHFQKVDLSEHAEIVGLVSAFVKDIPTVI